MKGTKGGAISSGWEIAKQSWAIVIKEKALWPFPLLSALASMVLVASFVLLMVANPETFDSIVAAADKPEGDPAKDKAELLLVCGSLAFYFINYFIVIFFNTALAASVAMRFRGETPTFGGGLQVALSRLPQILSWTLLAATVGVVLRAISNRSKLLGKIVTGLLGIAWTLATCLVVPTLAVEGLGPIAALKRSAKLISSSWGEGLVGNVGMGLFSFLLCLPALIVLAGVFMFIPMSPSGMIIMGGLSFVYFASVAILITAMKEVFIVALYFYAAENQVPAGFAPETLQGAFRPKGS